MKNLEISIISLEELPVLAKAILQFAEHRKVFAFYAQMGAGKTTLIKEICKHLGSTDNFSSPTYSVVNEYAAVSNSASGISYSKIFHMDCYRLKNLEEALDIGIDDYIYSENYCFIEWPELIEPILPADVVKISILADDNMREVTIFTK